MMVDPYQITNFQRTVAELEEFWLFAIAVAGKKATMISQKIVEFLSDSRPEETPFQYVARLIASGKLRQSLHEVKMGKYELLCKGYEQSVVLGSNFIVNAHPSELEKIHGVASKTSRFFVLHTRASAKHAVIDTHMLKYLSSSGYDVPKTIPTGKQYLELEDIVLGLADKSGMTPADFDLAVWRHYASNGEHPRP